METKMAHEIVKEITIERFVLIYTTIYISLWEEKIKWRKMERKKDVSTDVSSRPK